MAKLYSKGKIPKRIDDYVVYPLDDDTIIRQISGFTTDALLHETTYEKCRMNASEFGRVSSVCRNMRLALAAVLPKAYNLSICNSLVQKMRSLLEYDKESVRGERELWKAFLQEQTKLSMIGYDFIPEHPLPNTLNGCFSLPASGHVIFSGSRFTSHFNFPEGANRLGIRLHYFDFDFRTQKGSLVAGDWLFLKKKGTTETFELELALPEKVCGVLFTLLEIRFFVSNSGEIVPLLRGEGAMVHVLGVKY